MMDGKDCGGVILTAFHSFRIQSDEQKHTADNRSDTHTHTLTHTNLLAINYNFTLMQLHFITIFL